MASQEIHRDSTDTKYLSKRVLLNGQFVTLYSINGQTWLSSPEEIPELMARLENARIMLANPEQQTNAEAGKEAKKAPAPEQPQATPKISQNSKYRMKGPKPRPILRQGGVTIVGTPVEPISASNTVMKFGAETEDVTSAAKTVESNKIKAKAKGAALASKLAAGSTKKPRAAEKRPAVASAKAIKAATPKAPSTIKKAAGSKQSKAKVAVAKASKVKSLKRAPKTKTASPKTRKSSRK